MPRAFIGIGSDIDPERNVRAALRKLSTAVHLVALSTFYREPALQRPSEPDFVNGVAEIRTDLPPAVLKWQVLRPVEAALGRRRGTGRYAARTIDHLGCEGLHALPEYTHRLRTELLRETEEGRAE